MDVRLITDGGARTPPAISAAEVRSFDGIAWLDLDYSDQEGMALLTELIKTHEADVEDCSSRVPVPKLHVYADHHYSAINGVARGADGRLHFQPWKIFLTPDLVVTVLGRPIPR